MLCVLACVPVAELMHLMGKNRFGVCGCRLSVQARVLHAVTSLPSRVYLSSFLAYMLCVGGGGGHLGSKQQVDWVYFPGELGNLPSVSPFRGQGLELPPYLVVSASSLGSRACISTGV